MCGIGYHERNCGAVILGESSATVFHMADLVGNRIGDSFLNRCFETNDVMWNLQLVRIALFGWTEPYPLLVFVLLLLIILPAMFKTEHSFLKIIRIYNSTRLGLISVLHQVAYV
jgi:hypothetical protein